MASKSQAVRVLDVVALGPFMVWAGGRKSTLPDWSRGALVVGGVLTVGYNLRNYLATRKEEPTRRHRPPPARIRRALQAAANRTGVPLSMLIGVAYTESRYNPAARSPVGAMGLMQLMPGTADALGVVDPYDPAQNALGGAKFLKRLHTKFGKWTPALAAYNWGPGNVSRHPRPKEWPGATVRYVANVLSVSKAARA